MQDQSLVAEAAKMLQESKQKIEVIRMQILLLKNQSSKSGKYIKIYVCYDYVIIKILIRMQILLLKNQSSKSGKYIKI